jgi:hypothetical protein
MTWEQAIDFLKEKGNDVYVANKAAVAISKLAIKTRTPEELQEATDDVLATIQRNGCGMMMDFYLATHIYDAIKAFQSPQDV